METPQRSRGVRKQYHFPDSDGSEEFLPSEEDSDAVVVNIPEVCLGKEEEDGSNDFCEACKMGGELLCCDTCPFVFHVSCCRPKLKAMPGENEDWSCAFCVSKGTVSPTQMGYDKAAAARNIKAMRKLKKSDINVSRTYSIRDDRSSKIDKRTTQYNETEGIGEQKPNSLNKSKRGRADSDEDEWGEERGDCSSDDEESNTDSYADESESDASCATDDGGMLRETATKEVGSKKEKRLRKNRKKSQSTHNRLKKLVVHLDDDGGIQDSEGSFGSDDEEDVLEGVCWACGEADGTSGRLGELVACNGEGCTGRFHLACFNGGAPSIAQEGGGAVADGRLCPSCTQAASKTGRVNGKKRREIKAVKGIKSLGSETQRARQDEKVRASEAVRASGRDAFFEDEEDDEGDEEGSARALSVSEGVTLSPAFSVLLKPHQRSAVRFVFAHLAVSLDYQQQRRDVKSSDPAATREGGHGCVLAHNMGLGKTLSTIASLHLLLSHKKLKDNFKTVLIVAPATTLENWENEFGKWKELTAQKEDEVLWFKTVARISTEDSVSARLEILQRWKRRGGVALIGYESYVALLKDPRKNAKAEALSQQHAFLELLRRPGPDVVVLDEGHRLKNMASKQAGALHQVATLRRVILSGTPLQNNLGEYYSMLSWCRPSLLGTLKEFRNRFVNPVENGLTADASTTDIRLGKQRMAVLHRLVRPFVHRRGVDILRAALPPKHESVLCVRLTRMQRRLYRDMLRFENPSKGSLLKAYHPMQQIGNHPNAYFRSLECREAKSRGEVIRKKSSGYESMDDFIVESSEEESVRGSDGEDEHDDEHEGADSGAADPELPWHASYAVRGAVDAEKLSGKTRVFLSLLDGAVLRGERTLAFTQSLHFLDVIEAILKERKKPLPHKGGGPRRGGSAAESGARRWKRNRDYLRLDGSVVEGKRQRLVDVFNRGKGDVSLILMSTQLGLGINLTAATRVILLDSSWNPSNDTQAIFRAWRFGQTRPVFVYRLLAAGTIEEKIYARQVTKAVATAGCVDDEQLARSFAHDELHDLWGFDDGSGEEDGGDGEGGGGGGGRSSEGDQSDGSAGGEKPDGGAEKQEGAPARAKGALAPPALPESVDGATDSTSKNTAPDAAASTSAACSSPLPSAPGPRPPPRTTKAMELGEMLAQLPPDALLREVLRNLGPGSTQGGTLGAPRLSSSSSSSSSSASSGDVVRAFSHDPLVSAEAGLELTEAELLAGDADYEREVSAVPAAAPPVAPPAAVLQSDPPPQKAVRALLSAEAYSSVQGTHYQLPYGLASQWMPTAAAIAATSHPAHVRPHPAYEGQYGSVLNPYLGQAATGAGLAHHHPPRSHGGPAHAVMAGIVRVVVDRPNAWTPIGAQLYAPQDPVSVAAGRVAIAAVEPDTPAARAGLRPGDAFVMAGGTPVPRGLHAAVASLLALPLRFEAVVLRARAI